MSEELKATISNQVNEILELKARASRLWSYLDDFRRYQAGNAEYANSPFAAEVNAMLGETLEQALAAHDLEMRDKAIEEILRNAAHYLRLRRANFGMVEVGREMKAARKRADAMRNTK